MISIHLGKGLKVLTLFVLQCFSSCDDGLTYNERGQVVTASPVTDTPSATLAMEPPPSSPPAQPAPKDFTAAYVAAYKDTAGINTKSVTPDDLVTFAET